MQYVGVSDEVLTITSRLPCWYSQYGDVICCHLQVQKARQILLLRERLSELHRTDDLNLLDHEVQKKQRSSIKLKSEMCRASGDGMEKGAEFSDTLKEHGEKTTSEMEIVSRCVQAIKRGRRMSWNCASKVLYTFTNKKAPERSYFSSCTVMMIVYCEISI